MAIRDVTRPLGPGTMVFPGDAVPSFRSRPLGGSVVSDLTLSTHSGTHIDAPSHYLPGGTTVDRIPPGHLVGRALVLDLRDAPDAIPASALSGRIRVHTRLLLRTRFSTSSSFSPAYPHLTPEAAALVAEAGITTLGIDSPSIEAFRGDGSVHRLLLGQGMAILELLDLDGVPEGSYWLVALPLRLQGRDGSPARVILIDGEEGA
ncbi:MAG: cyclase family protein [Methanomicrobiales archaeon]|nr:cyclase family protein [Methanomicrobiales archaeon]